LFGSNRAAKEQNRINREMLELQRLLGTAGIVTARGDRIRFVPGVGWVTEPTDVSRNIIAAADAGERRAYTGDEVDRVIRNAETMRRGRFANLLADRIMQDMALRGDDADSVTAALMERNVAQATDTPRELASLLGVLTARQGVNGQNALDALARRGAAGTRTAIADARLMGPTMAMERRAAQRNSDLQGLAGLIPVATASGDAFRGPSSIGTELSALVANRSGQGAGFTPQRAVFDTTANNLPVRLDQAGAGIMGFGRLLSTWQKQQQQQPQVIAGMNLGSITNPIGGANAGGFLF
jgi:hypothetical protein